MKNKIELTNRETDLLAGLNAVTKVALATVPVLGSAIAGYESYKRSIFERNLKRFLEHLQNKVADICKLLGDDWVKTKDGQSYFNKVIDSALDAKMEEKQEFFVNALINGIENKKIDSMEKLKFVDMLRQLSYVSLFILVHIHKIYEKPLRKYLMGDDKGLSTKIDMQIIYDELNGKYHPYLIESAISEMKSIGLFSAIPNWFKNQDGKYSNMVNLGTGSAYTGFTYRFIDFITREPEKVTDLES